MVDKLLLNNTQSAVSVHNKFTAQIKRSAESLKIPVKVVATSGRKPRDLLTSSRPLDQKKCPNQQCITYRALGDSDKGRCTDRNEVYEIKCGFPSYRAVNIGKYNGEIYRPVGERFTEHDQSAKNPTASSYQNKPFARHYNTHRVV